MQMSQLQSLIIKGNIDAAFQQALSASATASDLSLVLYVCENVNPDEVFSDIKCILQQHVLLSLVQQLGADLAQKTDVKLRYPSVSMISIEGYCFIVILNCFFFLFAVLDIYKELFSVWIQVIL